MITFIFDNEEKMYAKGFSKGLDKPVFLGILLTKSFIKRWLEAFDKTKVHSAKSYLFRNIIRKKEF